MEFEFNKRIWFSSACYNSYTDTITLNFGKILRCDQITDDEKIRLMTWQIEHEVLHSVIYELHGRTICKQFDDVSWTLQNKEEFLELRDIFNKVGYGYGNKCKHLEKE